MQLLINGYPWEVKNRTGNEFTLYCPLLDKTTTGRPRITNEVEVIYPGHPKYITEVNPLPLSTSWEPIDEEKAMAVVSVRLGGRVIGQRLEAPRRWIVPAAAIDTEQHLLNHLIVFHDAFLPDPVDKNLYKAHEDAHAREGQQSATAVPHEHGEIA
jgi:hypothetical protein